MTLFTGRGVAVETGDVICKACSLRDPVQPRDREPQLDVASVSSQSGDRELLLHSAGM